MHKNICCDTEIIVVTAKSPSYYKSMEFLKLWSLQAKKYYAAIKQNGAYVYECMYACVYVC